MEMLELIPSHKIGDIVVYRDDLSTEEEGTLVQAKILGATAKLEDSEWVWSYKVEPVDGELSVFLTDIHIVFNLSN